MLKSVQIKAELAELVKKGESAVKANDLAIMNKLTDNITAKRLELETALADEAKQREATHRVGLMDKKGGQVEMNIKNYRMMNSIVKKFLTCKPLSEEEKNYQTRIQDAIGAPGQVEWVDSRGGYIVPLEELAFEELRKEYPSLRQYVDVLPVSTKNGWFPVSYNGGSKNYADALIAFDELSELQKDQIYFTKMEYNVKDYGLIIPLSKQLLMDASVDVLGIVSRNFARRQAMLENAKILDILDSVELKDTLSPSAGNTKVLGSEVIDRLKKAWNVDLATEYGTNAVILTNQDGIQLLDTLWDSFGHPLLQPTVQDPTTFQISGHTVIVVDNAVLKGSRYATEGKNYIPFFVGDLKMACCICDRMGLEIASSEEAGFSTYSVNVRAVSRFDFLKKDLSAVERILVEGEVQNDTAISLTRGWPTGFPEDQMGAGAVAPGFGNTVSGSVNRYDEDESV